MVAFIIFFIFSFILIIIFPDLLGILLFLLIVIPFYFLIRRNHFETKFKIMEEKKDQINSVINSLFPEREMVRKYEQSSDYICYKDEVFYLVEITNEVNIFIFDLMSETSFIVDNYNPTYVVKEEIKTDDIIYFNITEAYYRKVCGVMTNNGIIHLPYRAYDFLLRHIPNKEYDNLSLFINSILTSSLSGDNQETEENKIAALREYKSLLDEGIITEEEFKKKKKQLLQ